MTSDFQPFDLQHLIALLTLLCLGTVIAWVADRSEGKARVALGWGLGSLLLAFAVSVYLQQARDGSLQAAYSLPMELCDWVLVAAVVTLFRPNPFTAEITYFWGAAGTLQAVLTPDIDQGFPSWQFIAFFWGHGAGLLSIVYIIAAQKFRPRPGSVLRMMIALNVYGFAALMFDLLFGWNYGYMLHKPAQPSLLDVMGPWPWYLLSIEALALVSFWLLEWPWRTYD